MCECQGNPLARVTLALGLPYLLVNGALDVIKIQFKTKILFSQVLLTYSLTFTNVHLSMLYNGHVFV